MNESFQEFCKRILPAVQAVAGGKKIDFFSNSEDRWVGNEGYGFWLNTQYRISEPKATPLKITPEMWAMIDPKYQWAVFTKLSHGYETVGFSSKPPKFNGDKWDFSDIDYVCTSPLNIDTAGIIPELSLTKRPEQAKAKDYPEPPEFTVNVERLTTAAEMLKEFDEQHELDKKSELDECKSQATHYMQTNGGKLFFRKVEGDWQLLHELSRLWTSAFIVNHSSLIEIK